MGSGRWLKTVINLKRLKDYKSKKMETETKRSNGKKWKYLSAEEPKALTYGTSRKNTCTGLTEDAAATRIQTAFRAYKARKALRRLKGVSRFRGAMDYYGVKTQASSALNHIHFWSRIQAEIRARWLSMVTEGRARQKRLENQLKLEAKLHELEVEWCGGSNSMEEILQRIQQKEEAAVKRERAMAYAFSHQWKANSNHYFGQAYYDLGKESWGWSWKERWIAVRPWENRVQAMSVISKKVDTKQKTSKSTNAPTMKIIVSDKALASNGKDNNTQGSKKPSQNATKQD